MSYLFGGDTGWTYDQLQRKRELAQALASQMGTPRNVGEGLSAVGKALAIRGINKKADSEEARMKGEFDQQWSGLFGGLGGGGGGIVGGGATPGPSVDNSSRASYPATSDATYSVDGWNMPVTEGEEIAAQTMRTLDKPIFPMGTTVSGAVDGVGPEIQTVMGRALEDIVGTGAKIEISSGIRQGAGDPSGRHRTGQTMDFAMYRPDGTAIKTDSPEYKDILRRAAQLGMKGVGFGYGNNYMGPISTHADLLGPNTGKPGAGHYWADAGQGGFGGELVNLMRQREGIAAPKTGPLPSPTPAPARIAQGGPVQNDAGPSMAQLAAVAGNPMASPTQRSVAQAMMQRQMQASDPMRQMQMEEQRLRLDQMRNPQPDLTGTQREYDMARQQGYQGSFMDYQRDLAEAKRAQTTVNVGAGESKYDETLGKSMAEQFITLQEGAAQATGKIATLEALGAALDSSAYTGTGGEALLGAKRAARGLGINIGDDVGAEETARALGNQLALMLRSPSGGAGMPGAMSDKDREFLVASVPGLTKTPEGNRKLLDYMMRVERRNIQIAQFAQQYAQQSGGRLDGGFYTALDAWSRQNPLFGDEDVGGKTESPSAADGLTPEERRYLGIE